MWFKLMYVCLLKRDPDQSNVSIFLFSEAYLATHKFWNERRDGYCVKRKFIH